MEWRHVFYSERFFQHLFGLAGVGLMWDSIWPFWWDENVRVHGQPTFLSTAWLRELVYVWWWSWAFLHDGNLGYEKVGGFFLYAFFGYGFWVVHREKGCSSLGVGDVWYPGYFDWMKIFARSILCSVLWNDVWKLVNIALNCFSVYDDWSYSEWWYPALIKKSIWKYRKSFEVLTQLSITQTASICLEHSEWPK